MSETCIPHPQIEKKLHAGVSGYLTACYRYDISKLCCPLNRYQITFASHDKHTWADKLTKSIILDHTKIREMWNIFTGHDLTYRYVHDVILIDLLQFVFNVL